MAFPTVICRTAVLTGAIVMGASDAVSAQSFVCRPIAAGETAPGLARRLLGHASATYSDRFQIRHPERHAFVPKSQYARLSTRWEVCVAQEETVVRPGRPRTTAWPPLQPAVHAAPMPPPPSSRAMAREDVMAAARAGIATFVLLLSCTVFVRFLPAHAPPELRDAGEEFVGAFVRPLIDPGSGVPPILVRLRFIRHPQQVEIRLAPNGGRRYPNLRDHKRNVEYDIQRILRLLGPNVVISNPVRAEGRWVVVPIRLVNRQESGAS
jgi:hypothetical protein